MSVEWIVPADWGVCVFNVYFGQTQDGPWIKLNTVPLQTNFMTETESQEYSKFEKGYYVVEAILKDKGSAILRSFPTSWNPAQSNFVAIRAREINRREYILLNKFIGIRSFLFRRRTYGRRCPECWDFKLEKVMKDHCPKCLGTSFEGGYFDPIPLLLQYDPSPNNLQKNYQGIVETNQLTAWTIAVPEIRLGDIIIRLGDWNLYLCEAMNPTELQGNTVKQTVVLTQLSKKSVEYKLVQQCLPDFPERYFAN